jgi:hypothetical protein
MQATRFGLAIGLCVPLLAQSGSIMIGNASKDNVAFSYETRLEPPAPPIAKGIGGGVVVGQTGMHRFMTDSSGHRYFGYDLLIEPVEPANTYRVTFRPLSIGPEKFHLVLRDSLRTGQQHDLTGWTMLPMPAFPAPQSVHGGDTIALDLFSNPATGQKIVDYIRIQDQGRRVPVVSAPARDFSIEDAELRFMEPRLSVNGKPLESIFDGGISGAAVWFSLPDHRGRYILSLAPHSHLGFQKAGEVRGPSLSFTLGGDTFTLQCSARIAPADAPYNLYVLHDPSWRPKTPNNYGSFLLGSADRPELLIRR